MDNLFQVPLDTLVVDQDNIKEIQCGICLQILVTPRQCRNGHLYCLSCIEQSLKKSSKCPQCRCSLSSDKLGRSLFLEKHLRNLNVYCKNHFKIEESTPLIGTLNNASKNIIPNWTIDESGCNFIGPNENIETHELNCEYRFENCKYSVNNNNSNSNNSVNSSVSNSINVMMMSTTSNLSNSIHGNCSGSNNSILNSLIGSIGVGGSNSNSGNSSPIIKLKESIVNNVKISEDEDSEGNGGNSSIDNSSSSSDSFMSESGIAEDCGKLRFKDLENHYLNCPFRPTLCGFCKLEFPNYSIKEHENNCDLRLVECSKCLQLVPKKELTLHLNDSCPNQIISCTFGDCNKTFERKDLIIHLNESLGQHLMIMKQQQQDEISLLKKEFTNQLALKDEKIKGLEKLVKEKLSEPKIKIDWKIKNYLDCKKNGYVQSEKFIIEGFPFFVGIFTDGDNNESKGYISIYLFLDTGDIPKGRCINTEFSLKFNNQRDPLQSLNREYKATFPIRDGSGWGDRRSIKTNTLETNGYIKDNSLLITAEITVKKVLWLVEESQCDKH